MSTWQDLRDLLEMYSSGGLVIMTRMDGNLAETAVTPPSSEYTGKTYNATGIRTTIQFDSDYVITMSPSVMHHPQVWQQHMSQFVEGFAQNPEGVAGQSLRHVWTMSEQPD